MTDVTAGARETLRDMPFVPEALASAAALAAGLSAEQEPGLAQLFRLCFEEGRAAALLASAPASELEEIRAFLVDKCGMKSGTTLNMVQGMAYMLRTSLGLNASPDRAEPPTPRETTK